MFGSGPNLYPPPLTPPPPLIAPPSLNALMWILTRTHSLVAPAALK